MNERLLSKLRQVTLRDIVHLFLFLAALLPSAIFKMRRPDLWLICESANEARDNGYWLFRFLCRERPQVDAVYAICRTSPDYAKVASLGQVVEYGSFRHWVYYLAAKVNLSSQKSGKPNAAVCYLLEVVLGVWKNRRVFLQHGVIMNDLPFLYREKAKFSLFCCSAPRELEWVRNRFGYPPEAVQMVRCRFCTAVIMRVGSSCCTPRHLRRCCRPMASTRSFSCTAICGRLRVSLPAARPVSTLYAGRT